MTTSARNRIALIPLKSFATAKQRLRVQLSDTATAALVERLALGVIVATEPLPTWIVTDDVEIEAFAAHHGVTSFHPSRPGLNEGIQEAYHAAHQEFAHAVIIHADLAQPHHLGQFDFPEGITLFTDHLGLGTNVLALPTGLEFVFRYGSDSARSHVTEGRRLGFEPQIINDSPWRFDIDSPEDLSSI